MAKDNGSTNPEVAALQAQLAEMQQQITALLQQQRQPTPDTLWAKNEMKNQAVETVHEVAAAYISLPTQMRSQYEANKVFTSGGKIFSVLLGTGKKGENPQLFIKADSPIDAEARYKAVCGIRYVVPTDTHPEWSKFTIVDMTNSDDAKKAVSESWVYQPAV